MLRKEKYIYRKKILDKSFLLCYTRVNLIFKSYDEDGFYQAFSQRVGGGESPIKTNRNHITSELKVQKSISQVGAFRVCYVSA